MTGKVDLLSLHPTPNPVALIVDAIKDCTARADIVLDPFLGSGTTVIAAERTGRLWLGLDLDPCYVDVAIRRWQTHTGLDAVLIESGETFRGRETAGATTQSSQFHLHQATNHHTLRRDVFSMDQEDDYRVGYGKPPRASQYDKATSGNPKGRPKASTSPDSHLM